MSPELEEDIKTIRLNEKHPWPWAFGQVATEHVVYRMIAALEEAQAELASAKADQARYQLTDAEIIAIAESMPCTISPDPKGFASWGNGYRKDADGRYTIPEVFHLCVPFARRVIDAAIASQQEKK